jgi:hypothetical protein
MARPLEMEDAGPLRAVTRGVVPLRLRVTPCLTCCRCLPFLLASQTALTPSADPQGKPGLHYAHLALLHGRAVASSAGRVAAPPADPPACDARRRQRAGTVQIPSVRPRSEAACSSDLLIRSYLYRVQYRPDQFATWHDRQPLVRTRPPGGRSRSFRWLPGWLPRQGRVHCWCPARLVRGFQLLGHFSQVNRSSTRRLLSKDRRAGQSGRR